MTTGSAAPTDPGPSPSIGSTLAQRPYGAMWSGLLASYVSLWMSSLVIQWYLVGSSTGGLLSALVPLAVSLPMALLALPAGILGDSYNKRVVVALAQVSSLAIQGALVGFVWHQDAPPAVSLVLLGLLSGSTMVIFTTTQSLIPDVVDHQSIPTAVALAAIATNAARVVGPAIAGLVVMGFGTPQALIVASIFLATSAAATVRWGRVGAPVAPRERIVPSVVSGYRYVRHSPQVVKLIVRGFWFTGGMVALISLVPLLAASLDAGSAGLGFVLAFQGLGAILGALSMPRLRRTMSLNRLVSLGYCTGACALLMGAVATHLAVVGAALVLVGWSWIFVSSALQTAAQLYMPAWVRARGLASLFIAINLGQAVGALIATGGAASVGLRGALALSAVVLLIGAGLGLTWPLLDLDHLDRSVPRSPWVAPDIVIPVAQREHRVEVRLTYVVPPDRREEFLEAAVHLRTIRRRTGALAWQMHEDIEKGGTFVESFLVASWAEYQHQRQQRYVVSDLTVESRATACSTEPVVAHYLVDVPVHGAHRRGRITGETSH